MAIDYFANFGSIYYNFKVKGKDYFVITKDITRNTRFRRVILENVTVFDEYDFKEGDTPEIISEKIYGTPYYHWVIMLINQRYDYSADFPLPLPELEKYITEKYGIGYESAVHHYEDERGFVVDQSFPNSYGVTNYEFETRLNEGKRRLKIINPTLLPTILEQFKDLI